ncbi:MAG: hypothetical protein ACKOW2_02840 [Sphingobacteriaceae bacterium]
MARLKLNKAEQRKLVIFFTSLAMATILWLAYALSNRYIYPVKLIIEWTGTAHARKFIPLQSTTLDAKMEGTGWQLLFSKVANENQRVKISLQSIHPSGYLELKPLISRLSKQLSANQKIIAIHPDTLFFNESALVTKRVPVKLLYQLGFEPYHGLSGHIKLNPAYVSVSGSAKAISELHVVETQILKKSDLNTDFTQSVLIKDYSAQKIQIYPEQIQVSAPVNIFSEKVLELPIQIRNNHEKLKLKLLPEKVKVTILVALNNYKYTKAEDFNAYVDIANEQLKNLNQLPIKFSRLPNFIKLIKTEPQTVDFIIYP